MARPPKLECGAIALWLERHPGWSFEDDRLARTYTGHDFGAAMALAVQVGFAAERRCHHPNLEIRPGYLRVVWTTHDAGGVTSLDLELAEETDRAAGDARAAGTES